MKILKDPSPRKLLAFLQKEPLAEATVLHYTGNMWGIGARLSAKTALSKINKLKQRDKAGMIVLVPDLKWFAENGIDIPDRLYSLMQQYFPGNISMAFPCDNPRFNDVSMNGKVAFRVPTDPMLRAFIEMLGEPIISTSVNYTGLPAENDINRLEKAYAHWFDFALYPHRRAIQDSESASTLIEYCAKSENGIEGIKCLREGSVPFYGVKQSFELPMVMFVCTANICRSPIAEKLFSSMIKTHHLHLTTDSCGLLDGGQMISLSSMQLLMEAGIPEAQQHISKQITPQIISHSWLILTMEVRQRDHLRAAHPEAVHKILTLNEITGFEGDVEDPYGSDLENYRKTFAIISERLNILVDKIINNKIKL